MGSKDITEKMLEDYTDVFADIINVFVFDGERRVIPSSLKSMTARSMYKSDDGKLHEQERDIAKIWKGYNVELAICGIENQTKIDKRMPLRIAGYEGASYRSQLVKRKPIPVISIVLYFGTSHWNGPLSIRELVTIPKGLEDYINDTKIHVFEISWLSDEKISLFESDFKVVANFFAKKRRNRKYIPDDKTEIKHVDEVLKLLSVMTGDTRYEQIARQEKKGSVKSMCDVAERLENRGRAEGRIQEIYTSVQEGDYSVIRGAEKLGVSVETFKKQMVKAGYKIPTMLKY